MAMETSQPLRHPEKAHRDDQVSPRKPDWIRVRVAASSTFRETHGVIRSNGMHTVCEEAACPNVGECWAHKHATFMILGAVCTRACAFCNVATGKPGPVDPLEPERLAKSAVALGLRHVVITSVDRDDLPEGGATQFVRSIEQMRALAPSITIEVLTPDFRGKPGAAEAVIEAGPDVFNHNLETVPRLYPSIRPGARYYLSLRLLDQAKAQRPSLFTKSGIMVGLGEQREEIMAVMDDLRCAGVDFLTIGQYLQPTPKHAAVARFVEPAEFEEYKQLALAKGFLVVASSPLTRSSYHADRDFETLRQARATQLGSA